LTELATPSAPWLALAGGLGFFLLGLELLTDGLRLAAGPNLQRLLSRATDTRWRGLGTGILITALVQSSSLVTFATIGFVNAGLLTLHQSLWVIFGANIGTTVTGWLVTLVGFEWALESWALPLVAVGAFSHLTGKNTRRGALGLALAGFGLLITAIDLLKSGLGGAAAHVTLPIGDGPLLLLAQTGAGFLLTVLLFSSSAATALILTAIHSGLIDLSSAAAMVIGANLGTSVKAFLAAIGATANAKRAAAAHILFNTLTAVVAFLILPALVTVTTALTAWSGAERDPAIAIALFHTLFNVLGVVLIWPLANPMAAWLQRHFRTREEDEAQPRYLDHTLVTIPDLALSALQHELVRLRDMASAILERAIVGTVPDPTAVHAVRTLTHAIARFIAAMNQGTLTPQLIDTSERLLRVARYYESAARFAEEGAHAWGEYDERDPSVMAAWERFRTAALALLPTARNAPHDAATVGKSDDDTMEAAYQDLKAALLAAGSRGALSIAAMDAQLRAVSAIHRGLQQLRKGITRTPPPLTPQKTPHT